MTYMTKN